MGPHEEFGPSRAESSDVGATDLSGKRMLVNVTRDLLAVF